MLADPTGRKWYDMIQSGKGAEAAMEIIVMTFSQGKFPKDSCISPARPPIEAHGRRPLLRPKNTTIRAVSPLSSATNGHPRQAATTFIATSSSATMATRRARSSRIRSIRPWAATIRVDLWKWMDNYESKTGGNVLAIAHNGNFSNGTMFPIVEDFGKKLDSQYAETRLKWERLYETTQTKGDGEAHPFLSPNDEFANFEIWDKGNLDGSVAKTRDMLEFEYTRSALKNGLKLEKQLGANPYKFGLVGSSDAHNLAERAGGRQFLRQDGASGAEPRAHESRVHRQQEDRREDHGLGDFRVGLRRRLGHGEHARVHLWMRWSGAKPMPRQVRAWRCASSADGISPPTTPTREARR